MRVTSRSESENSFFDRFLSSQVTLVEFWMCFESAIEAQRHKQSKLNNDNKHSQIPLKTKLNLEVHASEIYTHTHTHTIFKDFQTELVTALFQCSFNDVENIDDTKRLGLLCRQCLWLLHNKNFQKIREEYIVQRWTKAAMSKPVSDKDGRAVDVSQLYSDRKIFDNRVVARGLFLRQHSRV
ncbi:protein FAR1-RELATED SEQUENCE 5-like [Silene latifolia]|uniref:protein FAR1-RELATED SEQUENCE 5-like n=1 Tax=Silene latifolia TaxID=37657 RepID=UPI003D76B588